eukprot:COSAG02_NODE_2683_length_8243_cov_8.088654_3_plen_1404_part_00
METLSFAAASISMAANDQEHTAAEDEVWWTGDGVWETQVADDSEQEPFRYEFTTQGDGTVNIVRLDGEDKISEGTASYDGDSIDAEVFGGQYSAEIADDGVTLVWSDGDEWSRVSTRRKAVAPRRRLLSKAATTSASPIPSEALQMKPIVVASPVMAPAFPKAATPSFSFSPAPAAAVMPPTSNQPVFTFSSSASKPAAPIFSFPDIPVTPAVSVPAALGTAVSDEDSSSAAESSSAGGSEKQAEDTNVAPEATEEAPADAQETVIPDCYDQQLKILVNFYTKYESEKTESDCKAILDKRKGDADAMTTLQFSKLCGKLAAKYGVNPMDTNTETGSSVEAALASRVDCTMDNGPQTCSTSNADGEDTVSAGYDKDFCVVPDCYDQQLKILVNFYTKYESEKTESDCKAILDKRKGDADAMTTLQFSKLCGKLAAKYGVNPMDISSLAAEETTAACQVGDRAAGLALIDEGKVLQAAGDNEAALSRFQAALVEFDGNRPKLEQRIAALKKTMDAAILDAPTLCAVEHDPHSSGESEDEFTDQLGRLKDWVRSLFSFSIQPTRQLTRILLFVLIWQEYLTTAEMNAATQLGWSADQWDEGMAPSCPLKWADLSNEQVASAEILGYDSTSWNWNDESADYSQDTASDESTGSEEISQVSSSESSSESEEDEMDEFGRALAPVSNLAASKPVKFTLNSQPVAPSISMAANDQEHTAAEDEVWWTGDGVWETQVADDSEQEPFRYEFTTQGDGTVNIVRLDGEDKISEGTASYDGDSIDAEVFGGQYSAEIADDGVTLVWSDGDEWSRVSTRRKAVAPRRRLLSKAATTSASPIPSEALQMKPIVVASPVMAPAFPKAATPSFSFSPAPAAAVMPPTSNQPVFTFSSSASKPAAPIFSFPDIPVTPAVSVPAALGTAVSDEDSSSAAESSSAGGSEKQAEDTNVAPEATEEAPADAQETVIPDCYDQQLKILVNFYTKYESEKTESDCKAILDKRKGDADAMTTLQFSKLCGKLAAKYGVNPMDTNTETGSSVEAALASRVDCTMDKGPQTCSTSNADGEDTVSAGYDKDFCVVPDCYDQQLKILVNFYTKYESKKTESDCKAILDKRKGDADAMTTLQFSKLCGKLAAKYGVNPMDISSLAAEETTATSQGIADTDTASKQSDCEISTAPLKSASGWNATKNQQAACDSTWACEVCLVKNADNVLLCAACETCKPGCEEEAASAKKESQDKKEAEMKENMLASAAAVKAAGITFGLPSTVPKPTVGLAKPKSAKAPAVPNQTMVNVVDMDAAGALDWLNAHVRLDDDGMQVARKAFQDKSMTGVLLEAATMQTLKTKYGISSWGVRLKINLALSQYQEKHRTASVSCGRPESAGVAGVQQGHTERNAVKTFSPIRSPRSALSAIRVN